MDKYPDYKTYRALYARYYERGAENLLRLLEPLEGQRVLDLCGGEGRLALAAIDRGAREVFLVDASEEMIPTAVIPHVGVPSPRLRVYVHSVENFLVYAYIQDELFDRVVCQQAVNYWLNERTAEQVALVLKPGGVFAFNTFNREPSALPLMRQYELGGHAFVEVVWTIDNRVQHVQVRDGLVPHYTEFAWIPPERFREWLEPHFMVTEERRDKTSLYRCVKK